MWLDKKIFYGVISIIILVAIIILLWNNQNSGSGNSIIKSCGMEGCHGLDIKCGYVKIPSGCGESYAIGDNCRQFAKCESIGGICVLKKDPKFDICKSCIEKCLSDFKNDTLKIFKCEESCYK